VRRSNEFPALPTSLPATPVKLRICDGEGRERTVAASVIAVEQAFAPGVALRAGTEISLTDGQGTLVALAFGTPGADASGQVAEFLLSSFNGEHAALSGPVSRSEVLRRFRQFVLASVLEKPKRDGRVSP
jgi:hypothetical protein